MERQNSNNMSEANSLAVGKQEGSLVNVDLKGEGELMKKMQSLSIAKNVCGLDSDNGHGDMGQIMDESRVLKSTATEESLNNGIENKDLSNVNNSNDSTLKASCEKLDAHIEHDHRMHNDGDRDYKDQEETDKTTDGIFGEEKLEPIFDGTEVLEMESNRAEGFAWPEKAVKIKNFVEQKSLVAVTSLLHHLSRKGYEVEHDAPVDEDIGGSNIESGGAIGVSPKTTGKSVWNPLSYIMPHESDAENKDEPGENISRGSLFPIAMKGRIIVYTRLGCQDCRDVRLFLHRKRLRYVEINIDVYPGRKAELEKFSGSCAIPKVFFNEILMGNLSKLKSLDESGKLAEKIDYLITEEPSFETPLPPLSGEDDVSSVGPIDELALIVQKMKSIIVVKDRFYKMHRFTNCFLGSEAVDFLSEDQYLEREEAVEFGRKLASKLFFRHVLDENLFEDGNGLYRFLDHDPIVSSQCHNVPRGIIELKPKPISEIASRMQFLSYAIFEAYASEDGKHVDYRSIHGSEEFARYLRIVEELQRVELQDIKTEEKLAFFINLYNMMAIHAILILGHPTGPLERRKLLGDFKYVIGGSTYSLSAIQNGILRCNQRPPYNLLKPFGVNDKRLQIAIPCPEPLIHFALVCGTRSGPALRCYSARNIDKELTEAARNFLRNGGLIADGKAKVAYVSKILKWYSVDFGNNEAELLQHVSNYLEPSDSEVLLQLLDKAQLKVIYRPYDWGLNC
ncbi:hypothetical protein SLE2022_116330 [Rubroshorea leprosula]